MLRNFPVVALILWSCSFSLSLYSTTSWAQLSAAGETPKVVVDDDGTVKVPAQSVPMSTFLSPEAKAYVTQHLKDMQDPEILKQDAGVPRFMKGYLARGPRIVCGGKERPKSWRRPCVRLHAQIRGLGEEQRPGLDQSSRRWILRLLAGLRGTRIHSRFCLGRD